MNPVTNKIYVTDIERQRDGDHRAAGAGHSADHHHHPAPGNQTANATPSFTFNAQSTFSPNPTPANVFFQVDTWQGAWTAASAVGSSFTGTTPPLQPGFHILYAFAYDGQQVGAIAASGFLVSAWLSSIKAVSPAQDAIGVSQTPVLTWGAVAGAASYDVYFGTSPSPPFVMNTTGTSYNPATLSSGTTYFWYLVSNSTAGSTASTLWSFTTAGSSYPSFFTGEAALGGAVYYLQFPDGNLFGYYAYLSNTIIYHFDMGYEGIVDAPPGGAYMYDFLSGHWLYTSTSLFPDLYDFTLNAWLYYFPDPKNTGHYTTGPRYFVNFGTGAIFSM